MKRSYRLYSGSAVETVAIHADDGDTFEVEVDGRVENVAVRDVRPGVLLLVRDDGATLEVPYVREGDAIELIVRGVNHRFEVLDEMQAVLRERRKGGGANSGVLKVAMPGRVIAVQVNVGDAVTAGQGVVVVEAMKMENELKAPVDGTVTAIQVQVGGVVEAGDVLLTIEPLT